MSTRPLLGAAVAICSRSARIGALSPMISVRRSSCSRSEAFSRSRRPCSRARVTVTNVFSSDSGFSMKSQAPRRVALIAVSMVPWPEIMTTVVSGRRRLSSARVSRPSMRGIQMSRKTRSGISSATIFRASAPEPATLTR